MTMTIAMTSKGQAVRVRRHWTAATTIVIGILFLLSTTNKLLVCEAMQVWDEGDPFSNPCLPHAKSPKVCPSRECINTGAGEAVCSGASPIAHFDVSIAGPTAGVWSNLLGNAAADVTVPNFGSYSTSGLVLAGSGHYIKFPASTPVKSMVVIVEVGAGNTGHGYVIDWRNSCNAYATNSEGGGTGACTVSLNGAPKDGSVIVDAVKALSVGTKATIYVEVNPELSGCTGATLFGYYDGVNFPMFVTILELKLYSVALVQSEINAAHLESQAKWNY